MSIINEEELRAIVLNAWASSTPKAMAKEDVELIFNSLNPPAAQEYPQLNPGDLVKRIIPPKPERKWLDPVIGELFERLKKTPTLVSEQLSKASLALDQLISIPKMTPTPTAGASMENSDDPLFSFSYRIPKRSEYQVPECSFYAEESEGGHMVCFVSPKDFTALSSLHKLKLELKFMIKEDDQAVEILTVSDIQFDVDEEDGLLFSALGAEYRELKSSGYHLNDSDLMIIPGFYIEE